MRRLLLTVLVLGVPRAALACPVCFGQSDSPMAVATNMGIFFMLGLTLLVLAGFGAFFIYLMRRAKFVADHDGADAEGYVLRAAGPVLHASESRFFAPDRGQKGTTQW